MNRPPNIPKWPFWFFVFYCRKDRLEEMHGDLEEYFYERLAHKGRFLARLYYVWDVLRCCQPYAWKRSSIVKNSNTYMFSNYLKTSLRSMIRNPVSSFINVFGLSVAVGVSIVVYSMIEFTYRADDFHEHRTSVYLATYSADRDGISTRFGTTPAPLGLHILEDHPQVHSVCRIGTRPAVVKFEDQVFHEHAHFVDPSYLQMLSFPLASGVPAQLADVNSVILSNEMAIKYFGYEDPLGEELTIKFGEERKKPFVVAGVAAPFPRSHAIRFDFLVNFENLTFADPTFSPTNWDEFLAGTLIQLEPEAEIADVQASMSPYLSAFRQAQHRRKIHAFGFEQLATLRRNSSEIVGDISIGIADEITVGLPIMGLFMLALACLNYINMAIGSATKRLKEIGLRKVIGADRRRVVVQFMTEHILVAFLASVLGLLLTAALFLPWFSGIAGSPLEVEWFSPQLWLFLIGLALFVGFVSGLYPALYVSKFQVVKIIKGTLRFGKNNPMMKAFLCFQMILAFVFITMAVMFYQNSEFQARRPWGYNQHGALYAHVGDRSSFEKLSSALSKDPHIEVIAGSSHHLGSSVTHTDVQWADGLNECQVMSVDGDYFTTMGIEMVSGESFQGQSQKHRVIVNELFVETMAMQQPIGSMVRMDSSQYQVVGVVKDFHAFNFYYEMRPMVFRQATKDDYRYLTMRVQEGTELETYDKLRAHWVELFPDTPFQGGQQVDLWAQFYSDLENMKRFTRTVAIVAILLAALGLYGLVSLNIAGRIKEFSIRKVLGAGLSNLTANVTSRYSLITLLAFVIGAPLAYFLNLGLIGMMFAYPLPHGHWGVIVAFVLLFFVMFGVLSTQISRVSKSNPVSGLRSE